MRKKVFGRKLSRDRGSRHALFRSLIEALVRHGKIVTTKAKAKAVQPDVEKLVSLAKTKDVNRMRQVYSFLANDSETSNKIFNQITLAFASKKSGFTRIVNLPRRLGDNAEMARIEWTEKVEVAEKPKDKKMVKKELKKVKTEEVKKATLKSRISKIVRPKK